MVPIGRSLETIMTTYYINAHSVGLISGKRSVIHWVESVRYNSYMLM